MVPHATGASERRRSSSSVQSNNTSALQSNKFPDFVQEHAAAAAAAAATNPFDEDVYNDISRGPSPRPLPNGLPPGLHSSERWPARKSRETSSRLLPNGGAGMNAGTKTRHGRQKSLSEAISTVRTRGRGASIHENVHEIAESLKAPVSMKLVVGAYPILPSTPDLPWLKRERERERTCSCVASCREPALIILLHRASAPFGT